MNYKDTLKAFIAMFVILNMAESELVAEIRKSSNFDQPAVGKNHRLYCRVENSNNAETYQYRWKINNETIIESSRDRYGLYYYALTIKQITKEDRHMTIQCQAISDTERSEFSTMVVLDPRYGPSAVTIIPEKQKININENKRLSLRCSADCRPECRFEWSHLTETLHRKRTLHGKNVDIINATRNDAGYYSCKAISPDSDISDIAGTSRRLRVIVYYGPDSIRVSSGKTSYDAIEGKTFGPVTCNADCFPCSYKWRFRSNGPTRNFQMGNVLNIEKIQRNFTGRYICVAKNKKLNSKKTMDITIDVHYGPDSVTVSPFQAKITIKEGSFLRPRMCSAECGTRCVYTWTKDSRNVGIAQYLFDSPTDRRVIQSDMANYTCYARNSYTRQTKASESFVINVLHGPKNIRILLADQTPVYTVITKEIGSSIGNLYCSADCNPGCNYTWTSDNNNVTKNGHVLTLGTATFDKDGTYFCTAVNEFGSSRKVSAKLVIEEYGIKLPNSSVFIQSPFTVVQGSPLHLECHAKCTPPCYLRWYIRNEGRYVYTAKLQYRSVKRDQTGIYDCYDFNVRDFKTLQIIVQYPPSIVKIRLTNPYRIIGNNDVEIKKGSALELECQIDSVPAANITWRRHGNQDVLTSVTNMSDLIYSKEESECEDFGKYICEAENGIGDKVNSSINVHVRCPPHLTPQKRRKMKSNYKRELGSDVMFSTEVRGYPPVEAKWFFKYNHTAEETLINPTENNISSVDGVFSLHIGKITEENYGVYLLELSNEEGNLSFTFSLEQPKSMVSAPGNVGSANSNKSGLGSFIGGVIAGIALLCLVVIALVVILMRKRAKSQKELSNEPEVFSRDSLRQFDQGDTNYSEIDLMTKEKVYENMAESSAYNNTTYALDSISNTHDEQPQDSYVNVHRENSYTYAIVQKRKTTGDKPNGSNFEVTETYAEVQKRTSTEGRGEFQALSVSDEQVLGDDQGVYANGETNHTEEKIPSGELDKPAIKPQRKGGDRTRKRGADRKSKPKIKPKPKPLLYVEVDIPSPASETSKFVIHGAENRTVYSLVDFTKHAEPLSESELQQGNDEQDNEPKFKTTEEGSEC